MFSLRNRKGQYWTLDGTWAWGAEPHMIKQFKTMEAAEFGAKTALWRSTAKHIDIMEEESNV